MTFPVSLIWVLGGLLASGLAGLVLKRGGYGLITDISLGLGGSLVGSLILGPSGIVPESGLLAMVVVAFVGAAGVIVVQRKMWPTIA
ncbi:MAG TPA: hypothetical protein VGW35_12360 [Methylomirabilota bacterium]|jgi:uncharacterized membrane protein YeaQ/YmgE (transglycosylase-associated protein family)|nr:hypothetical protein [Methylomirabilota bacterium]